MAETRRYGLTPQLDIEQILLEAQHRWLRPAEICEILRNHQKFHIAPEPPNRPPSGSLFLFDRKVLRYFRKDGHNWRKKKDGKTVKEAHERLKAGSVDVLHCYYAHGEENGNFQRRSYWMLEEDFMHIVLVHYREVKNKESYSRTRDVEEITRGVHDESPAASNSVVNYNQRASQATDAGSPSSAQTSEYEDAEPADNSQASSRYNPLLELRPFDESVMDTNLQSPYFQVSSHHNQGNQQEQRAMAPEPSSFFGDQEDITKIFDETGVGLTFNGPRTQIDLTPWDEILEHAAGFHDTSFPASASSTLPYMDNIPNREAVLGDVGVVNAQSEIEWQFPDSEVGSLVTSNMDDKDIAVKEEKYASLLKQLSLDFRSAEGEKGLQKHDSFSRWMSKELGEVGDAHLQSSSRIYWDAVASESVVDDSSLSDQDHLDTYLLSPSLSQDQLFSISDFSPNWAYAGSETKVLIYGTFLKNRGDIENCNWSCMFGEVEVPAEVSADGVLECYAPPHKSRRVPFYVTCSNRLACSEVREFEYRASTNEMLLYLRLENMLSEGSIGDLDPPGDFGEKAPICNKISSLLMGTDDERFHSDNSKDRSLQELKEKLCVWLLQKVGEDGKGPNILDKEGQGVIHLAAALGYDWVMAPTIAAGVNINFRDLHGWTALHWAASCGRERTVVALLALRAAPGLLTDPTPGFPSGRTPADLASSNGHKGIAGFLAESSLTTHLESLTLKQAGGSNLSGISTIKSVEDVGERNAVPFSDGDVQAQLSLKDSLSAVRNAAQAAARIHQAFRVDSFQRKEHVEYGDDNLGMSAERALSLIAVKANKTAHHDEPVHTAAVRIQNRYRGWKGRKEFLVIRQRIVKIQAHVRGYQVRKHFRKIVWSVGIVEKVILRWRRKGSGLRGFRSAGLVEGPAMQVQPSKEDDYDFLQEGRKQTEARLERALARVKSMVQYPEARDQYRRLLTGVEEFQESKVVLERILNDSEDATDSDMMLDLDELLGDDALMPTD